MTSRITGALVGLALCCATILIAILIKGDVRAAVEVPFASFSLETKERPRVPDAVTKSPESRPPCGERPGPR